MTSTAACAATPTATSNPVTMTVNPTVTPSVAIAGTSTICSGTSTTFTATPTNGGTPSYQWKLNGVNAGTNIATYTNAALANSDVVSCVMTSTAACATIPTATSNNVTMTVNPTITPSVAIAGTSTICAGSATTFTATPTNGGTPTYEWQVNGVTAGTNSTTYSSSALANSDVVSCIMTTSVACPASATVTSNSVSMTVNPMVTPAINVTSNPNGSICSGVSVTFTATPSDGGVTPVYQWTLNGSNVGTASTYTNATLANSDVVICYLTSNASCIITPNAISNTVTMNVSGSVTPTIAINTPATTVCAGSNVTFTATPNGGGSTPTYQWYLNGNTTGTNNDTYSSSSIANSDVISCILTSSLTCALTPNATSNSVAITVTPTVTPSVSFFTGPVLGICPGTSLNMTATPVNGGTIPTYNWYLDGTLAGTGNSYSVVPTNGQSITCTMTSNANCATPATVTSTTYDANVFTVTSVTVSETTGTLNSTATTGNQWFEQVNGLIASATSQAYTPTASGNYYTIVADVNGCTTTSNTVNFVYTSISNVTTNNSIVVYPNPVTDFAMIEKAGNSNEIEISLIDIQGRVIESIISTLEKSMLNMSNVDNGIYFIRVTAANKSEMFKIVKQ